MPNLLYNYNIARAAINSISPKQLYYPQYKYPTVDDPYSDLFMRFTPITNDEFNRINVETSQKLYSANPELSQPYLKGLSNVDYDTNQLIKLGNDWKKSVNQENGTSFDLSFIPSVLDFAGSVYNGFQYDKTASDLAADAGYGRSSAMGVGYTTQNVADSRQVMSEEHANNVSNTLGSIAKGAAAGSAFGLVGAGIGAAVGGIAGLFGGGRRHAQARRELALQQEQTNRTNIYNRNLAMTTGMQQNFAKKYGNQENQVLLTANGKDEEGGTFALTQPFETKDHDGKLTTYLGGKTGVDSNLDYVEDGDTIFSLKTPVGHIMTALSMKINRNKGKNLDIANRAARATVEQAKQAQKEYRALGLLPEEQVAHAKWGIDDWGNFAQTLSGIGTAFGGYLQARGSRIHRPDIRVADDSSRYINDLYALQPDNLAIYRELRNAEARGRYQLASAGGLGAGQRALANVGLTSNTQNSIATAMAQSQDRFNALRSQAATAGLNASMQRAQRDQAALQYNDNMYQYAAAARQNAMSDYLAQIPAMIGTYAKGLGTSARHNDMMNMYRAQIAADAAQYMKGQDYKDFLNKYGLG